MPEETRVPHVKKSYLILGILLILCAVGWWYVDTTLLKESVYSALRTPYEVLAEKNPQFGEAEAFFHAGKYADSLEAFRASLAGADDRVQEAQIKMKIARATEESGRYVESIGLYKEIVGNANYYPLVRAYAAQQIAMTVLTPSSKIFLAEIATTEPYRTMVHSDDRELTKRDLFEYASSIYPLAVSELISATWYADELVRMTKANAPKGEMYTSYLALIKEKIANAEKDMLRTEKDSNEYDMMAEALKRKALLLGKLASIQEVPVAEAEGAYARAVDIFTALGGDGNGYMRYFHALYIYDSQGASAADTIQKTLAPLMAQGSAGGGFVTFLAGERFNNLQQKASLQKLAAIDPAFKNFLLTVGWQNADF